MEKIVCALWRDAGQTREGFNAQLLASLPAALTAAGASRIRINLRDAAVDPAAGLVQQWQAPQQDAVVQFWLPSANALFRDAADQAIARHCARFAAWLVCESTIIANTAHAPVAGERTWGWSQASFITFRSDISRTAAVDHWHGHHTRVAIDTQANCFPPAAMSDPAAFFAAEGDEQRLRANVAAMMDSCRAFLDFGRNDIIPTSQFDFS